MQRRLSTEEPFSIQGTVNAYVGGALTGTRFTGVGALTVNPGVHMTNDANDYTGRTHFSGAGGSNFTSIGNLGEASSLGAPTTVADGRINIANPSGTTGSRSVSYIGDGDVSDRNWTLTSNGYRGTSLINNGTGTLTLTGAIAVNKTSLAYAPAFTAGTADLELLGVISGNDVAFNANAGRVLRLGNANTFSAGTIGGAGKVEAATLANIGVASSLGAGSSTTIAGTLSYTGAGASTNRNWALSGTLANDGTGALALSGGMGIGGTATLGGSFTGADNVISGGGNLRSGGDATWVLTGANTYTGQTIVDSGTLRAGSADAFGASTRFVVNGGTLDLNGFDRTLTTLTGTGGALDLGSATLTLEAGTGTSATFGGSITGSGGLTKLGASAQTLTGASTYTGDTTIGGGTLNLDFSAAGAPSSNIIGSSSTLNMSGGILNVIGADNATNTQTFDGLNITAGNNTISASAGAGGTMTVNLGAITRTGGLINFNLPESGNITTTNTSLGGWATVNGTDYAKVEGGNILAFEESDYTDKDNAGTWANNEYITDVDGFYGTVNGSVQLAGLRYTQPVSTTVTVATGETLGVDGTIIVAPSVLNANQLITGGMMTGANGGVLAVQQNSTGNFTIDSRIVDNGAGMGFTKAGTGLVTRGRSSAAARYPRAVPAPWCFPATTPTPATRR
jgi:fibronectin-binding autotransporter adhesin